MWEGATGRGESVYLCAVVVWCMFDQWSNPINLTGFNVCTKGLKSALILAGSCPSKACKSHAFLGVTPLNTMLWCSKHPFEHHALEKL